MARIRIRNILQGQVCLLAAGIESCRAEQDLEWVIPIRSQAIEGELGEVLKQGLVYLARHSIRSGERGCLLVPSGLDFDVHIDQ